MALFGNLFGHYKDPSKAAMPYINQIPGQAHEAYDPYINRGNQAGDQLSKIFGDMGGDPMGFYNKLLEGYEPSRDYQLKRGEALGAAGNSAAAGGYRGSQADLVNSTNLSNRLLGDDMQQWVRNVMGIQGQGLAGQQNMYNTGFNASTNLAGDITNAFGQQAQYAAQGAQGKNAHNQAIMNAIMQFLSQGAGTAASMYSGGAAGGAAGAAM